MPHVDEGRLHAFLDGEVTGARARRLEEHVRACERCEERLEEAARVRALAGDLVAASREAAATLPDWEELTARADRRDAPGPGASRAPSDTGIDADGGGGRRPGRLRAWGPALAWAATLVLAFTLGWEASRLAPGPAPTRGPGIDRSEPLDDARIDSSPAPATEAPDDPGRQAAAEEEERRLGPAESGRRGISAPEPPRDPQPAGQRPGQAATSEATEAAEADEPEAAPGPLPAPRTRPRVADIEAVALAADADPESATFRGIRLEDADQWLGRPPLELEGGELQSVELGPPGTLPGALPGRPVLRLRYHDARTGKDVVVLQQTVAAAAVTPRRDAEVPIERRDIEKPGGGQVPEVEPRRLAPMVGEPGASDARDLQGLTLTVHPDGERRLRWLHPAGYLVALQADADEATLRELMARLR